MQYICHFGFKKMVEAFSVVFIHIKIADPNSCNQMITRRNKR